RGSEGIRAGRRTRGVLADRLLMIDAGRVLQPLDAAAAAIERLDEYRVPAELADAIEETQRAVDRALRLLLRADARAPDDLRLTALSPDTPLDRVVAGLRQRGLRSEERRVGKECRSRC